MNVIFYTKIKGVVLSVFEKLRFVQESPFDCCIYPRTIELYFIFKVLKMHLNSSIKIIAQWCCPVVQC